MAKIFGRPDDHRTGIGWTLDIFAPHGWGRKLETQWILELSPWKTGMDRYPLPPGGRKRHADDGTLRRGYADIPESTSNTPWEGPHIRILFESEDPALYREARHRKPDRVGPG